MLSCGAESPGGHDQVQVLSAASQGALSPIQVSVPPSEQGWSEIDLQGVWRARKKEKDREGELRGQEKEAQFRVEEERALKAGTRCGLVHTPALPQILLSLLGPQLTRLQRSLSSRSTFFSVGHLCSLHKYHRL